MKNIFKSKFIPKKTIFAKFRCTNSLKFKSFTTKIAFGNFKWMLGGAAILASGLLINKVKAEGISSWVSENYGKIDESARKRVLSALIIYPRTESLAEDKPIISIDMEVPSKEEYNRIIKEIVSNVQLKAVDVREDILFILNTLKLQRAEMLLDEVDCIQIYKGGLNILRIRLCRNKNGRSAFVEINSLRLMLTNVLEGRNKLFGFSIKNLICVLGSVGSLIAATGSVLVWLKRPPPK